MRPRKWCEHFSNTPNENRLFFDRLILYMSVIWFWRTTCLSLPIERIWFVISPHNLLKKNLLCDHHRLAPRGKPSETTLNSASNVEFSSSHLIRQHTRPPFREISKQEFALIMGSDNLESLHKWKNFEVIRTISTFIYPRPGFPGGKLLKHKNVVMTEAPLMDTNHDPQCHQGKKTCVILCLRLRGRIRWDALTKIIFCFNFQFIRFQTESRKSFCIAIFHAQLLL